MQKKAVILFLIGTRPEAIKLAPLIRHCRVDQELDCQVCNTGQHGDILRPMLDFFEISADYDLALMRPDQSPVDLLSRGLQALSPMLEEMRPDLLVVQGDTTTVLMGSLAGAYLQIPVAHIEAGLRSHDMSAPFPEELHRKLAGHAATLHFAPTQKALDQLRAENITQHTWLSGNTVIDALLWARDNAPNINFPYLDSSKKTILLTCHRRESFGQGLAQICEAVKDLLTERSDIEIVYPVHPNPRVRKPVHEKLAGLSGMHLIDPLSYPEMIRMMEQSSLILTDSGGVQEEAPSLNKPVLVLRDTTERREGIEAGTALLIGTDTATIIRETKMLLEDNIHYQKMASAPNPYGDGLASERIHAAIKNWLKNS